MPTKNDGIRVLKETLLFLQKEKVRITQSESDVIKTISECRGHSIEALGLLHGTQWDIKSGLDYCFTNIVLSTSFTRFPEFGDALCIMPSDVFRFSFSFEGEKILFKNGVEFDILLEIPSRVYKEFCKKYQLIIKNPRGLRGLE